jgi:putative membrane protein
MRKLTTPAAALALFAVGTIPPVALSAPPEHTTPAAIPARIAESATGQVRYSLDDATIVAIFDAANTADIETGTLAAERGHSKEVRELGAMFARDHRIVRQQGRDLAKKLGVTPTPPKDDRSASDQAKTMAMLRSKHGAEFDKAFLEHEVAFHRAVIGAIDSTLLPAIQNGELKALVEKVKPAFNAHMLAAQSLDKKLFGTETSSR